MSVAAVAVGGGALIGGVAKGVTGAMAAGKQAGAARDAAAAQLEGTQLGIDEQRRQFDAFQRLMSPYSGAGSQALTQYKNLMGMGNGYERQFLADGTELTGKDLVEYNALKLAEKVTGNAFSGMPDKDLFGVKREIPSFEMPEKYQGVRSEFVTPEQQQQMAMDRLSSDPLLQARIKQGEESILANASATGGLRGGNTQAALAQFSPAMIQDRINQEMASLTGMIGMGQGAAAGMGNAGMNLANNISNLYGQGAAAQANSALAQGNAAANTINSIGGAIGGIGQAAGQIGGMGLGSAMMGGPGLSGMFGGGGSVSPNTGAGGLAPGKGYAF